MVRYLEAVFEGGILRPIEPLSLPEHQRVIVMIDDKLAPAEPDRTKEMAWLKDHRQEYFGQWIALDGDRLIAHGSDARAVRDEARRQGVEVPLMHRPSSSETDPQAFWI